MKAIQTMKTILALGVALSTFSLNAQNVGIGTSTPKAALDISSTSSGLLIPRMNALARTGLTVGADQNGMQVYDTDSNSVFFYDHSSTGWKKVANAGTDKFVDGTDPLDAAYTTGKVGVGTVTPVSDMHVVGNVLSTDTVITKDINIRIPNSVTPPTPATGGDVITTSGPYRIHIFNSDGTFTPNGNTTVEYLVVAGGGGGGDPFTGVGGGGGAGGVLEGTATLTNTPKSIVIGAGGGTAQNGGNSTFDAFTAIGGGAGGNNSANGGNGGSGGGGGSPPGLGGTGTSGQGNAGGNSAWNSGGYPTGGGGGAGQAGGNAFQDSESGSGGDGIQSSISGTATWYGGGGGGALTAGTAGTGGQGGGGNGGLLNQQGGNGTPNTGGGGGGACGATGIAGNGGSGVVIVRYLIDPTGPVLVTKNANVGIGTDAPTAKLSVNGDANKPGGGTWAVFSDARSKEQVANYEKGLDEVVQLNPVNFKYKEEFGWGSDTHVGLIAQEVEKVVPSMVATKEVNNIKDFKEVDPNEITYMLINAVIELHQENTALEPALNATNDKVNVYENQLKAQALDLDHIENALKTTPTKQIKKQQK